MLPESIRVTLEVVKVLEQLGVRYAIGGSLASTLHGVVRATIDADLVVELRSEHAEPLAEALRDTFYVDAESIRDAAARRGHFNVIQLETMFKVDIFIPKERPFDHAQLERRVRHGISEKPEESAYFCTAEDTILAKLEWYRLGGGVSDRQWRDVLGVLRVQGDRLDLDYLHRMAETLEISELLERALAEAKTP